MSNFELKTVSHDGSSSSQTYNSSLVFDNEHDTAFIVFYICRNTPYTNQTAWTFPIIAFLNSGDSISINALLGSNKMDNVTFNSDKKTLRTTVYQGSSYNSYLKYPSILYAYGL